MVRMCHILLGLGLLLVLAAPGAAMAAPAVLDGLSEQVERGPMAPIVPEKGTGALYKADIFRDCQNIEGSLQCRTCQFVRRCGRSGCFWEEDCRWGPPVSPVPQ